MTRQRFLALVAAIAAAAGLAAAPSLAAEPHADTNAAVAVNTKDGSSLFRFAFAIRNDAAAVVDDTNEAVAYSSCTDCRTTAIAIEIVLVDQSKGGGSQELSPQNVAYSVNEDCSGCQTFAAAYQFVVTTNGHVHFTDDGHREIERIRHSIEELGKQNLSPGDLNAQLTSLMTDLQQVLANDLVPDEHPEPGPQAGPEPPPARGPPPTTTAPQVTTPAATTTTTATTTTATTTTGPQATTTTVTTTTTPAGTTTTTTTTPATTDATTTTTPAR